MIERGSRFQTVVFGNRELPEYIRVGKFMSKVRVDVMQKLTVTPLPANDYTFSMYLSAADIPAHLQLLTFDLISMPPVSLLKNLRFHGEAWQVDNFTLPANLAFCGGRNHEQS
jgi:CRISPR-associated protein Csc1